MKNLVTLEAVYIHTSSLINKKINVEAKVVEILDFDSALFAVQIEEAMCFSES